MSTYNMPMTDEINAGYPGLEFEPAILAGPEGNDLGIQFNGPDGEMVFIPYGAMVDVLNEHKQYWIRNGVPSHVFDGVTLE